ncbi:hypothetical protein GCM10010922_05810 [Microbacterium sorbitolivorans]|nr:hypothetical protein GCM10010922_05810 [Microbacterium sorbitolivorans]
MRAEDDVGSLRDLVDLLHEDRALLLELAHDVDVVHDLLAHVNGCAVSLQSLLHGDHGPVDSRAVTAGRGKKDPLVTVDGNILEALAPAGDARDRKCYGGLAHDSRVRVFLCQTPAIA